MGTLPPAVSFFPVIAGGGHNKNIDNKELMETAPIIKYHKKEMSIELYLVFMAIILLLSACAIKLIFFTKGA